MKVLRVVCRDCALGVAQAHELMEAIRSYDPNIVPELIKMTGKSDQYGEDAFFSAMETALEDGDADLCVHSLEEFSANMSAHLPLVALSERREARDVLVIAAGCSEPAFEKPLGAMGAARRLQLAKIYPGWRMEPACGEIEQLIERLDGGEFGALVLPEADIALIGMQDRIHLAFSESQIVPAPGQGIVAVRGRAGERVGFLSRYHSVDSWYMFLAEHSFCEVFAGSEAERVATVRASVREDKVLLSGVLIDGSGKLWNGSLGGKREDATQLGTALATRLLLDAQGPQARKIVKISDN